MAEVKDLMFDAIRVALRGGELKDETIENLTDENLIELFNMSAKLDVVQIVADVLLKNNLIKNDEIRKIYKEQLMRIVLKVEQIKHDFNCICEVFEENNISYIPLKGVMIRNLYLQDWMRNSCDIDVLVKQQDHEKAVNLILENLKCTEIHKSTHDTGIWFEDELHMELHFNLVERDSKRNGEYVRKWNSYSLEQVWEKVEKVNGTNCQYKMPDEMTYFYHIAHMTKHFEKGGCGIKPVIDMWILNEQKYDEKKRDKYLEEGGLKTFNEKMSLLSEVWFENGEKTEILEKIENYLINGGTYGDKRVGVVYGSAKVGGSKSFIKHNIFASIDVLRYHYPNIDKWKWLMPVYQVRRWLKIIFEGRLKKSIKRVNMSRNVSSDEFNLVTSLAEKLEI